MDHVSDAELRRRAEDARGASVIPLDKVLKNRQEDWVAQCIRNETGNDLLQKLVFYYPPEKGDRPRGHPKLRFITAFARNVLDLEGLDWWFRLGIFCSFEKPRDREEGTIL